MDEAKLKVLAKDIWANAIDQAKAWECDLGRAAMIPLVMSQIRANVLVFVNVMQSTENDEAKRDLVDSFATEMVQLLRASFTDGRA